MNKLNCIIGFILLLFINQSYSISYQSYKVYNYESYGTSLKGCPLVIGVVLDVGSNSNQVVSFSNNVKTDDSKMYYYEGTLQLFKLEINDIPFGVNDAVSFNVTDSNSITSNIIINLDKPFQCKKLVAPFNEISYSSDFYLFLNAFYGFGIQFSVSNEINIASSFTCELSFMQICLIEKFPQYYFVYGFGLIESGMGKEKLTATLYDLFGGNRTLEFDNNLFSYSTLPTTMSSYSINPSNTSQVIVSYNGDLTNKVQLQTTYSELNAIPILKDSDGSISIGNLLLGTPTSKIYYFFYYISAATVLNYIEVSSKSEVKLSFKYSVKYATEQLYPSIIPTSSIVQSEKANNNLIFSMKFNVSFLSTTLVATPVYISDLGLSNSTTPAYPYGYSKVSSNSYWEYNSDCLILPVNITSSYSVSLNSSPYGGLVKYPSVQNLINSDPEGPILRHLQVEQLENNKFIITFNITDKGTGVFRLFGNKPSIDVLALEILSAGNPNDGVYQVLADSFEFTENRLVLYAYDYYGNLNLNRKPFYYTDLNYNTVSPIMQDLSIKDIHTFKFNRHVIDTSFNDLDLVLTIGFNGASQSSVVPKIIVTYLDSRIGRNSYVGVFNKTSGMFDIAIKVQARESGYFTYSLVLPPASFFSPDLESVFKDEKVKLTANYIDHFPPQITYFKSITNTNLTIPFGDEIKIGWEFEVYDYPVGLDYGIIEVVSNLDFEPRVFTIKPNTSIPGSDIKSNYTVSFKIQPYVNHTYYISSMKLYDKNGYYSQYPPTRGYLNGFNSFYNNSFTLEQNIQIGLSNNSIQDNLAPELLSLSFPEEIDSFSNDRVVVFNFSLRDNGGSGISTRHNPYVHIQLLYAFQYKVQSKLITIDNDTGIHYYNASIQVEYGKLAYGSIVSIHGIIDNVFNMASFTSQQLAAKNFPSTIINSDSLRPPVIFDYSTINEDGGKLFIYGREFTNTPIVYMNKGNGYEIISTTFKSNLAITASVPNVKGYSSIQFKVVSKGLDSNIITITPIINPAIQEPNCTSLNNCNGKGQCIESNVCVCYTGYSGLDCSSIPPDVNNTKPNETPSISMFGSMIDINELDEIDINGQVVNSFNLSNWEASTIQSQYQNKDAYQYITRLNGTNTNVTITIDIFDQDTSISFASKTLYMDKGTIKYTITLNSYPFGSRFNTLQLKVNASLSSQDARCKLNSIGLSKDSDNIEYIKLRSDNKSIYGKFIQSAEIDYRLLDIKNKLLVSPTNENQNAIIGIQIPFYYESTILDPDFSVIFDVDDLGKNKDASCIGGVNPSGLSKSKIITVSVICSVVGVTIVIASVILFFKNKATMKFKKMLKNNNA